MVLTCAPLIEAPDRENGGCERWVSAKRHRTLVPFRVTIGGAGDTVRPLALHVGTDMQCSGCLDPISS